MTDTVKHNHRLCRECVVGAVDVGALTGRQYAETICVPAGPCCVCLREAPAKTARRAIRGTNYKALQYQCAFMLARKDA